MATKAPARRGATGRKRASKKTSKGGDRGVLSRFRTALRSRLGRQSDDVWGVVLLVGAVLMGLGYLGLAGPFGRIFVPGLRLLFGIWGMLVPVGMALVGVGLISGRSRSDHVRLPVGLAVLFLGTLAMFHLLTGTVSLAEGLDEVSATGGVIGSLLSFPLRRLIGSIGAFVVLFAVTGVGVLIITRTTVRDVAATLTDAARLSAHRLGRLVRRGRGALASRTSPRPVVVESSPRPPAAILSTPAPKAEKPPRPAKAVKAPRPKPAATVPGGSGYQRPPLDLLKPGAGGGHDRRSLEETGRELEETLRQHGVDARLTRIVPGPTVTRYEIELAPGVKVSRITSLANDIGYALATPDVRLLAPIPGKSAIGVEVPNRRRRLVTLGDILASPEAAAQAHPLTVALGMDISGQARFLPLAELPHALIAGATGAGKSSCINAIVTSLLMRTSPEDVRLILIDPKRVELGQYNDVPHLLTRVITNPKKAADALKWAVDEMDRRYELLADAGVRDIIGYREKWEAGHLDPDGFDRFPYMVVVVDELNDLMMVAGRVVEEAVVRIAQMARAVGIHLVIATQRPSVDVITGVIKANIPSRLAFAVASQADSRVILDHAGAEKLVGLGDMLVVTARHPKPERIQGAWVSEEEIHAVVGWIRTRSRVAYDDSFMEAARQEAQQVEDAEGEDPVLVKEAIDLVVRSQLGSTSMLQRKLRIGFARAGRMMDILERKGIVGPSEGSKARAVLIRPEELDGSLEHELV